MLDAHPAIGQRTGLSGPLGGRAGNRRRSRGARRAGAAERRLRGAARVPVRRLREPPPEGRDPRACSARGSTARPTRSSRPRSTSSSRSPRTAGAADERPPSRSRTLPDRLARPAAALAARDRRDGLDRHVVLLRPARPVAPRRRGTPQTADAGVAGELWEVHGGGFYQVQKYSVAPPRLPDHLAWFKWEAYTTWLSGFGLMIVLYYLDALERCSSGRRRPPAVAGGGDQHRPARRRVARLRRPQPAASPTARVLWPVLFALIALAAWGSAELFAPRAAWLQVGAMLGTVMAANVFFVIIPAHWELIRAKEAGREPDPRARDPGEAALGAQQLPDAARAADDARRALRVRVRRRPRLARPRRADAARRLGAPLLQPPPPGAHALVDAGRRRRGVRGAGRARRAERRTDDAVHTRERRGGQGRLRLGRLRRLPHACRRRRVRDSRPGPRRGAHRPPSSSPTACGTGRARCRRSPAS